MKDLVARQAVQRGKRSRREQIVYRGALRPCGGITRWQSTRFNVLGRPIGLAEKAPLLGMRHKLQKLNQLFGGEHVTPQLLFGPSSKHHISAPFLTFYGAEAFLHDSINLLDLPGNQEEAAPGPETAFAMLNEHAGDGKLSVI